MKKIVLNIEGMHCNGCVTRITNILSNIEGVKNINVSLENKSAEMEIDEQVISVDEIKEAISDAGFEV